MKNVCIIGMGYVGLTLAVVLAEADYHVTGVEIRQEVVDKLNACKPHFHEVGLDRMMKKHIGKNLHITTNMPAEKQDVFIISVGTPVDNDTREPLMKFINSSSESVKNALSDDSLVILRSTVPVGVTRNVVKPILDQSGKKYHLAFCPERTIEGKALIELKELPQIVGGLNDESVSKASNFFRKITPTIMEVSSLEAAEMIKIVNNTYRDVLFAYANEMGLICEKLKLDSVEIAKAANFGYERSNVPIPGFVGGACLSKDPYILLSVCKQKNHVPELIMGGRRLNESLPAHIVEKAAEKLTAKGKNIATAKVFVSGFAFKGRPETDDTRDSPTLLLLDALRKHGVTTIYGHDFIVTEDQLRELQVMPTSIEEGFAGADCVIIANNHRSYERIDIENLVQRMNKPAVVLDCWQIFNRKHLKNIEGIDHGGIGFD